MTEYTYLDLAALLRVPIVDPYNGIDFSADGRRVVFAWNPTGQWELYSLALEPTGQPEQLTSGPGGKFNPRFSPDGTQMAYAVDEDGSESFDLWLMDGQTGQTRNLTPGTDFALQPNFDWSPDGSRIACISNQSGEFCTHLIEWNGIHTVQPKGLNAVPLLSGTGPQYDLAWSPDGKWLAIAAEGTGQDWHTHLVPLDDPQAVRTIAIDGRPINAHEIAWSPDSTWLAFSSDVHDVYDIGLYAVETGRIDWITSGDGDKSLPAWSPDGRRLAYVHSEGPNTWLALREIETRETRRYQVEPGVHYAPYFTSDGRSLVCVFDNPRLPGDLWQLELSSGAFRQLTHSLPPEFAEARFVIPEHIVYPSFDEKPVPALLYLPGGRERVLRDQPPAVVVIHGGPTWLFQYLWYPFMSHLASRGWVVLAPNYRGSSGYGRDWQLANRFDLGRGDTLDVMAGANWLACQGLADPQRIAVTGRSHGGYLTMCCLTMHPSRWAGGSAVVPFLNWFTSHKASRVDLQHWDRENMGDPVENEALWRERSPYFLLDRIQAPVQLICGANDPRCPASESTDAHQQLLALGKHSELLLYHDEGHAFLKTENVIDHEVKRVEFLARVFTNHRDTEPQSFE